MGGRQLVSGFGRPVSHPRGHRARWGLSRVLESESSGCALRAARCRLSPAEGTTGSADAPAVAAVFLPARAALKRVRQRLTSVQSLGRIGRLADTRDDSAEIFQSFCVEGIVTDSGMAELSNRRFLRRPWRRPPCQEARKDGLGEACRGE